MIGMSQIKKKMLQGVAIGGAVGVLGMGVIGFFSYKTIESYKEGTNENYKKNYTQVVAVLSKDVVQGEIITDDMIQNARVHKTTVPEGALTSGEITGKVAKYSIAANVPIIDSMVTDEIIDADIRMQEVNTLLMPSDLNEGDSIDVRIMYPNGTDYIVLPQKRAEKIEGETVWIQLSEEERLLLNSSIVDSFLTQGTKLYATKYVDQDAQIKVDDETAKKAEGYISEKVKDDLDTLKEADETKLTEQILKYVKEFKNFATTVTRTKTNYQPNTYVMSQMKANSNILEQAKEKLSEEARINMESSVKDYKSSNEDEYENVVTGAKDSINKQKSQREQLVVEETKPTTTTQATE